MKKQIIKVIIGLSILLFTGCSLMIGNGTVWITPPEHGTITLEKKESDNYLLTAFPVM